MARRGGLWACALALPLLSSLKKRAKKLVQSVARFSLLSQAALCLSVSRAEGRAWHLAPQTGRTHFRALVLPEALAVALLEDVSME